jgi:hypothetical protein
MITADNLASLPVRDEAQIAHSIERSRALHDNWAGDPSALNKLLDSDDFTDKEKADIMKASMEPPVVYAVRSMTLDDTLRVYKAANAEERDLLWPIINRKIAAAVKKGKLSPEQQEQDVAIVEK